MAINAIGNGIPFPRGEGIPSAVRDSMILWYDPKRQGATNESMAANPVLRDLSGNGHDATCYNFAWRGMSGIGGYYFTGLHHNNTLGHYEYTVTTDRSKYTFTKNIDNTDTYLYSFMNHISVGNNVHYKIKITGLDNFRKKYPSSSMGDAQGHVFTKDGIYEHNFSATYEYVAISLTLGSGYRLEENEEINITVEQLPLYPNALVTDGVDDYAYVERLPLLTKERGYTVIAKRTIIDTDKFNGILAVKGVTAVNATQNAFAIDVFTHTGEYYYQIFGGSNLGNVIESYKEIIESQLLICTTKNINDIKTINVGDTIDNFPNMNLLGYPNSKRYIVAALYSFLFFDRDLTEQEIEWVKNNLIEGDTEL